MGHHLVWTMVINRYGYGSKPCTPLVNTKIAGIKIDVHPPKRMEFIGIDS